MSRLIFLLLSLVLLTGCATLKPSYDPPKVTVTSLKLAEVGNNFAPSFDIGLQVNNPNADAIDIKGLAYALEVEGKEILNGVSNDLPRVEGYGQAHIQLRAQANLLSGFKLFTQLLGGRKDTLKYTLKTKVDLGGIMPALRKSQQGEFSLSDLAKPKP